VAAPTANAPPFSGATDVAFAKGLWQSIQANKLVGPNAIISFAYGGNKPHGEWLENLETKISVDGRSGDVLVKNNCGKVGDAEPEAIVTNRAKYLGAITVMYRREAGYDTANQNWFWAKFRLDGTLDKNPKGMQLAGRVAKGKPKGCIACIAMLQAVT
jgi:hypothetical protein